jgi:hypothetical protein
MGSSAVVENPWWVTLALLHVAPADPPSGDILVLWEGADDAGATRPVAVLRRGGGVGHVEVRARCVGPAAPISPLRSRRLRGRLIRELGGFELGCYDLWPGEGTPIFAAQHTAWRVRYWARRHRIVPADGPRAWRAARLVMRLVPGSRGRHVRAIVCAVPASGESA